MQKKLAMVLAMFAIFGGLIACGSQDADVQETAEVKVEEASPVPEEETATTEVKAEANKETEVEQTEAEVQEKEIPTWYMDKEGLKSEELGIMIRRDSAEWSEFGFSGSYMITVPSDTPNTHVSTNFDFTCNYYEGDIDSYIAEHKSMEKKVLDEVIYAIGISYENSTITEIVFVENNIILSMPLRDYKIEDIWKNGLDSYEEESDYLVYVKDKDIYCPALGIKFSGTEDDDMFDSVDAYCSDAKYGADSSFTGGHIIIGSNYMNYDNQSAQERIDEYLKHRVENAGDIAIEEVVEKKFGNYNFIGKGSSAEYGSDSWMFASDDTVQEISIWYTEEYELEKYLSLIEELK